MVTVNNRADTTIQTVHAALIWTTLVTLEGVAQFYLRPLPKTITFYYLALGLTIAVCAMIPFLGKSPIVMDIQEICFYDVLVQLLGCFLFVNGYSTASYLTLAQMIIVLKLLRLSWSFCNTSLGLPAYWPRFGFLGWLELWRAANPVITYTPVQRRKFFLLLICLLPIGYLIQVAWIKLNIPLPSIIIIGVALWGVKKLIASLEAREQEHLLTVRDLGAAMGREQERQKHIAELTAINIQLDQKNAELERAYQERAVFSQKLAARNDRLADDAHDVKHMLVPMAFKVHDLAVNATTETQRDEALWLQTEIKAVSARIGEIIHAAKISNPQPASVSRQTLSSKLLCDYFFTRFNAPACERDITLICSHHANLAAISTNEESFKRIIANLLANAIAHTAPDGHIRLRFFSAPGCCYVHVLDNGPGMPGLNSGDRKANFMNLIESMEKRQFLRYQAEPQAPQAQPGEGHGVGLINVGRLCRELGIAITMRSVPGRGTAFRLKLPLGYLART